MESVYVCTYPLDDRSSDARPRAASKLAPRPKRTAAQGRIRETVWIHLDTPILIAHCESEILARFDINAIYACTYQSIVNACCTYERFAVLNWTRGNT